MSPWLSKFYPLLQPIRNLLPCFAKEIVFSPVIHAAEYAVIHLLDKNTYLLIPHLISLDIFAVGVLIHALSSVHKAHFYGY